jgi:hypothetical protein
MDSPLAQHSSPRRKRFGKPGQAAGTAASPLAWLQRHPLAAAAVYMLIGGCLGEQYRRCRTVCCAAVSCQAGRHQCFLASLQAPSSRLTAYRAVIRQRCCVSDSSPPHCRCSVRVPEQQPGQWARAARWRRAPGSTATSSSTVCCASAQHVQGSTGSSTAGAVLRQLLQGGLLGAAQLIHRAVQE